MEIMDATLIFSLVLSLLSSFFILLYIIHKTRKEKRRINDVYAHRYSNFNLSRDRIESDVYNMLEMVDSHQPILDASRNLFLSFSQKEHGLSTQPFNESFFLDLGIKLDSINVTIGQALCLMPFHRKFDARYQAVGLACKMANLNCVRSDEMDATGRILSNIVELILSSQIVIAIMDGKNPNVFYEIGIAHSLGKPVLLLMQNNEKDTIPFDLSSNYVIIYNDLNDLRLKLGSRLMALQK